MQQSIVSLSEIKKTFEAKDRCRVLASGFYKK